MSIQRQAFRFTLAAMFCLSAAPAVAEQPVEAPGKRLRPNEQVKAKKPPAKVPLMGTAHELDGGKPRELTGIVHSVHAHLAVIGTPVKPAQEESLVRIGYRRVNAASEIGHLTIHGGYAYAERKAEDEAVFASLRPGFPVRFSVARTKEGSTVIIFAR